MPLKYENPEAGPTATTPHANANTKANSNSNAGGIVKAFLVGTCHYGMSPVFAEAAPIDDDARSHPSMDDSDEGLRFVGSDGQEQAEFNPSLVLCYPGAVTEVKKYLYGFDVIWAPKGVDESELTRDRVHNGPVEDALEDFLWSILESDSDGSNTS